MRILVFVLQDTQFRMTNNFFIPSSLFKLGFEVTLADPNSIEVLDGKVVAKTCAFSGGSIGAEHPTMNEPLSCEDFDLVWFLDYPHPNRLYDYFRMLWVLSRRVPFVNDPLSVFLLNNKLGPLGLESARFFAPSSVLLTEESVRGVLNASPEQKFVLKPPDKGCGADVYTLKPGDPNVGSLIQSSLGNPAQLSEMFGPSVMGDVKQYVVLQQFIPS